MRSTLKKTQLVSNNESKVVTYEPKHVKRL